MEWKEAEYGVCCQILSPSHVRSYIHKLSPTVLPNHEWNKESNNRHTNVDGVKVVQEAETHEVS